MIVPYHKFSAPGKNVFLKNNPTSNWFKRKTQTNQSLTVWLTGYQKKAFCFAKYKRTETETKYLLRLSQLRWCQVMIIYPGKAS